MRFRYNQNGIKKGWIFNQGTSPTHMQMQHSKLLLQYQYNLPEPRLKATQLEKEFIRNYANLLNGSVIALLWFGPMKTGSIIIHTRATLKAAMMERQNGGITEWQKITPNPLFSFRSFNLFCLFTHVYEGHFMLCYKEEF